MFVNQKRLAAELGWSADRVEVHGMRVGGAFGGRAACDVACDAVLLARAAGRLVKVEWMRHDKFAADRVRPSSSHRVRLRANAAGRITDWWHAVVSGYMLLTELLAPKWALWPLRLVMAHFGAARSIVPPHAAVRRRIEFTDVELPVSVSPRRSLGATPNTCAGEIVIDALARHLGQDPVALRLRNINAGHRLVTCLTQVQRIAETWPRGAGPGFGPGQACGAYQDHSHAAAAFDVLVDPASCETRVLCACCVLDIGLAVNHDQIRARVEGCVMMAIGQVLLEAARLTDSGFASLRFSDYPTPSFDHSPELEITILESPANAPAAVGEVALVAAVPALTNALADTTVRPIERLPVAASRMPG